MRKRLKKKLLWSGAAIKLAELKGAIGQMDRFRQLCFFFGHQPGTSILVKNDSICKRCGIDLPEK